MRICSFGIPSLHDIDAASALEFPSNVVCYNVVFGRVLVRLDGFQIKRLMIFLHWPEKLVGNFFFKLFILHEFLASYGLHIIHPSITPHTTLLCMLRLGDTSLVQRISTLNQAMFFPIFQMSCLGMNFSCFAPLCMVGTTLKINLITSL